MAKGTGIAGLAGSLAEKLARDVRCVCSSNKWSAHLRPILNLARRGRVLAELLGGGGTLEFEHKQRQTGVTYWAGCAACCGDGCCRGRRWEC